MKQLISIAICLAALSRTFTIAFGGAISIGAQGINSSSLGLTGAGISIGQVETGRPADPDLMDDPADVNSTVNPAQVYVIDQSATQNDRVESHALQVAGIMISTDPIAKGVAPGASLYSSAYDPDDSEPDDGRPMLAAQTIATANGGTVWAINLSFGLTPEEASPDGNTPFTLFMDWSARRHDVLYVVAGAESSSSSFVPDDNYNNLTVASSRQSQDGVYRQVGLGNVVHDSLFRTFVDLVAPGKDIQVVSGGNTTSQFIIERTSYAAPHVTGTVALLQQYAKAQIPNPPRWTDNARRHEVMKAVLMNSADKIIDDGTVTFGGAPVVQGGLLGMQRTVLDKAGETWFQSEAFLDNTGTDEGYIPLDDQMGAGHLNANRAFKQFAAGEYEANIADVPLS